MCSNVDLPGFELDYDYVSLETPKKFIETIHTLEEKITDILHTIKAENKEYKLTEEVF